MHKYVTIISMLCHLDKKELIGTICMNLKSKKAILMEIVQHAKAWRKRGGIKKKLRRCWGDKDLGEFL